jgi:hypothetical protein
MSGPLRDAREQHVGCLIEVTLLPDGIVAPQRTGKECHLQTCAGLIKLVARSLFDHLISAQQQGCGHVEAQRFGSLEIDDELYFRDLLHR